MSRRRRTWPNAAALGLACLLGASMTAHGADEIEASSSGQERWTVVVSPYAWAASLRGKASLAGFNSDVHVPFSDVLKHLDVTFMGNVEATNGLWGVYVDGQYVQTSQDEHALGVRIGVKATTTILSGGAFFKAYEVRLGGDTVFGQPRRISFEPTVGLRWTDLRADVSVLGLHARKSADWTDPFVGLRINADLTDRWNLFSEVDVGGFGVGSKLSINAQSYLGYRTMLFDKPVILRAGYRVLYQNYEGGDFTGVNRFRWNVSQHGPVLGLSMLF